MTSAPKGDLPKSPVKRGAYCLANDEVLEWFQAFLRSFRHSNPALPLTVIPYNSSVEKLQALQKQFGFSLMDEAAASQFDSIGHRVGGQQTPGNTFRKLSCFTGGYETFLFLDSDLVVTLSLQPLLDAFANSAYDFVYFDTDISMVYRPEFARKMIAEYQSPGFNSGAFLARRNSVSPAEIRAAVESGEKVREEFSIWGEQPFLNYLFDITRRRLAHASQLWPEISEKPWARMPFHYDASLDQYIDAVGKQMPFIHWPGCEYPTMVRKEVFLRYRTLGMPWLERINYGRQFYYRRLRRNLRQTLLKFPLFATLLTQRDRRISEKQRRSARPA